MLKRTLTLTSAVLVGALAFWFLLGGNHLAPTTVQAQADGDEPLRVISVSGYGAINAVPDTAIIRLGVETEADTAQEALDDNSVQMSQLISATVAAGVAETDIQTHGLQLQPVYSSSTTDPQLTGYRASNIVAITARDLDGLGELLDAAIEAGGNRIDSIRFEVSDREALFAAAREAAMNDAIERAEQLTALAGAELGEVFTISEVGGTPPAPIPVETVADVSRVPVSPGMQTIEVYVQVSWFIN